MDIHLKRATEAPARSDGQRVLVDRLWPRGKSREVLKLDHWLRDIAPSASLRQWFGHDPAKWAQFLEKYFVELDKKTTVVAELRGLLAQGRVTLVYAAKDTIHNNAVALREYMLR